MLETNVIVINQSIGLGRVINALPWVYLLSILLLFGAILWFIVKRLQRRNGIAGKGKGSPIRGKGSVP